MKRVLIPVLALLSVAGIVPAAEDDAPLLPAASAKKLPRWRGFNLPARMVARGRPGSPLNQPLNPRDMRLIAKLGFNFVRLPLDYHHWIAGGDWARIDEKSPVLAEIDRMVEAGRTCGIHVCINFHTAPGYCINKRNNSEPNLWTSAESQRICAMHWAYFAKRYKGIPNERVSFNLWNEPARTDAKTHAKVARLVVDAIRRQDPDRLIICDGFAFKPAPELIDLGVAQAARGYTPSQITHYKATWIHHRGSWPQPLWPRPVANGWMMEKGKQEFSGIPLRVDGPIPKGSTLAVRVGDVFHAVTLKVEADGKEVWRREFPAGPGKGPWKASKHHPQWKAYQCTYDQSYDVPLPDGAKQITISPAKGHWIQVTRLAVKTAGQPAQAMDLDARWGQPASRLRYDATRPASPWIAPEMQDRAWLWTKAVQPWVDLSGKGVGVMVGEFGVFNQTPHDVTLAFLEDCLANYKKAGFGWALWNFTGSFGVLDSHRSDVQYEDWEGHKLDRKMLDLLQKY